MKQAPDAIYIVTLTPARAEELKKAVILRGFDEILCIPYDNAALLLKANPPALALIDMEGDIERATRLMEQVPETVRSIVLSDTFDDALFVTCHDHGARDFLVKPVEESYLASRIIRTLQEHRVEQLGLQKDRVLVELGVVSSHSGVFTTSYLIKLLKKESEDLSPYSSEPLSLLLVQLEGYQSPLPEALQAVLLSQVGDVIRHCARGFDQVGEYFMDKFAVILPQTGRRGAKALANRILQRLHGLTFQGPNGPFNLEVRVGAAEYEGCRHYEDLISRAMEDLKSGEPKKAEAKHNPLHPV